MKQSNRTEVRAFNVWLAECVFPYYSIPFTRQSRRQRCKKRFENDLLNYKSVMESKAHANLFPEMIHTKLDFACSTGREKRWEIAIASGTNNRSVFNQFDGIWIGFLPCACFPWTKHFHPNFPPYMTETNQAPHHAQRRSRAHKISKPRFDSKCWRRFSAWKFNDFGEFCRVGI